MYCINNFVFQTISKTMKKIRNQCSDEQPEQLEYFTMLPLIFFSDEREAPKF
jgi:hypothetical protein